ncbi:HAMP domain-containing protein [bacterium]|nr:HAMP domain-containing protein [bacterium]
MKIDRLIRKKLFRKLFALQILFAVMPLALFMLSGVLLGWVGEFSWLKIVLGMGVALTPAVFGAYYLARRISLPVIDFTRSATEIARGNFSHRIHIGSNDEIGRLARIFNYMVTEFQRLEEMNLNKIISEKSKTETIIQHIADGVIVTDPKKRLIVLNKAAEKWFCVKNNDVINYPVENILKNEDLAFLIQACNNAPFGEILSRDMQLKSSKQRKPIFLQAKAVKAIGKNGDPVGTVTILRDITREREIDQMKTEVVSMVAHELRSPLTSIAGFSELLQDSSISREQQHDFAKIILTEANRLGELINKFLDISRIESGKNQLNKIETTVFEVVFNVLGGNIHIAERKQIEVETDFPDDLPLIRVDSEMMGEVILNLFSNAVKYSPPHTKVTLRAWQSESQLAIQITDQGYGIPEKDISKIFDKFYRVSDSDREETVTGTGLGLALVKEVVEAHNGTIDVVSHPDKGSQFTVRLPLSSKVESQLEAENCPSK